MRDIYRCAFELQLSNMRCLTRQSCGCGFSVDVMEALLLDNPHPRPSLREVVNPRRKRGKAKQQLHK